MPAATEDPLRDRAVQLTPEQKVRLLTGAGFRALHPELDDLSLPGLQDELVRAVGAGNPRTVAVINAGAAAS